MAHATQNDKIKKLHNSEDNIGVSVSQKYLEMHYEINGIMQILFIYIVCFLTFYPKIMAKSKIIFWNLENVSKLQLCLFFSQMVSLTLM